MNNFIFQNETKVCFGKGCVKEYLSCAASEFGNTVLLAYGQGAIKQNGIYDEVIGILDHIGKTVIEFPGIMPNPTYQKVMEGAALCREHTVDMILAVGGGSVIDCCKAVSMASITKGDVWARFWGRFGVLDFEPLPVLSIVTAAGSGSEMNGGAVITHQDKKIKTGRDYIGCAPKFAFLDPTYTFSVPKQQMISGGFDILSHIVETYFSGPDGDNVSDDISEALMRSVIRDLRAAIREPKDYTARSNLMWTSAMAENRIIKLGKKTDFQVHQIEHQLGAYTDCNHGCGLAVITPSYYRRVYSYGLKKFAYFAQRVWGIPSEGKSEKELATLGVEALADFIKEIGLPTTLREMGVTDESLLKPIADSCNISPGSYKRMTRGEILEILHECF